MNLPPILGEVITEIVASKEVDESDSIREFVSELTDDQKERFRQIAHHLVYLGFEEEVTQSGDTLAATSVRIEQILDNREASAYIRGFFDAVQVIEEAGNIKSIGS